MNHVDHINKLPEIKNNITGMMVRNIAIGDKHIYILYIPQLTNRDSLSENIIKPLMKYNSEQQITAETIMNSVIYSDDVFSEVDENKITDYIIEGKSVILISNSSEYIVVNTLKVEKRSIQSPEVEASIRSPRDAFNENLDSNLSLIRYRIKDSSLKIENCTVGKRTRTSVAIIYMQDVANPKHVSEIKKTLEQINVDGVLESGYIQRYISNKNTTLFPQIGICERSDTACANILDGKVCIVVNGSNLALVAPKNFIEFLDVGDDHYDNLFIGIFMKFLRFLSIIITLTLSSVYVAIVAYHPDIIPSQYILALAASRVAVPVNAVLEAILMEVILELLREANLRLPKQIGSSISIVGTIVIGQALVFAGLVSPLMIIIVALSSMASFAVADYTIMNPIRLFKFIMILLTGIFGLYGLIMGLSIFMIKVTSITSFGVPYTAPVAPFNFKDIKNYIISSVVSSKERPSYIGSKDRKRQ